MYSYNDRVSYSEVDANQNLTYFALVNYMQNCSCFHSDDVGYGLNYLAPLGLGWFVTSYEIHINRLPRYSEKIKITTYPYNFRGMMARRTYTIETEDGELLAYADSQWILMNLADGKPARAPEELIEAYNDGVPRPEFSFLGDRLKYDGGGEKVGEFRVTDFHIDTNGHMNNSYYIDITNHYLDEDFSSVRINYKKAAKLDDNLDVVLVKLESGNQVVLMKDDEVYTIVEYK